MPHQTRQIDTTFIEQSSSSSSSCRRSSLNVEHGCDSGIDSVQASPSPIAQQSNQPIIVTSCSVLKQSSSSSPTPSDKQQQQRRLLHPDHARNIRPPTSPDNVRVLNLVHPLIEMKFNFSFRHRLRTTTSSTETFAPLVQAQPLLSPPSQRLAVRVTLRDFLIRFCIDNQTTAAVVTTMII